MRAFILWGFGLLVSICLVGASFQSSEASIQEKTALLSPAVKAVENELICEELPWTAPIGEEFDPADVPEYEKSWAEMVEEVVALWEKFFDMEGVSLRDRRRQNFELYAEYVADAVIMYQNQESSKGRLPRHENTHLIIATVITKESSVTGGIVNKQRGEVGLMQVMPGGPAMAGLKPEYVQRNPKLQIFLGTRWLALQVKRCYPEGVSDSDWTDEHWLGPLSVYGGGGNGISKKTGKCRKGLLRDRVTLMKMYRNLIDMDNTGSRN